MTCVTNRKAHLHAFSWPNLRIHGVTFCASLSLRVSPAWNRCVWPLTCHTSTGDLRYRNDRSFLVSIENLRLSHYEANHIFSYWSFTDKKQHIGKSSSISQEQNYWATCTHVPIIKPFCLTSLCKTSLPKLFKNHPPNLPSILFLTWCMYLYYKFYFKSSQTAPQRNRPTSSRTAMCGHWWCQALVEHAKLCSFWLLCEKYDIWHMTYVYIRYLYLHISIFIFYSRHIHIYADITQNISTIFICVVVERSSSFAGSRRFA